jgi:hypothetical protein
MPSIYPPPIDVSQVQSNVLRLFRDYGPMDDYQLIERYRDDYGFNVSESTPRTRRRELADKGLLKKSGLKNIGRSGLSLTVWSLA